MSLTEYRRKRKFDATREPEPGKPAPRGRRAIFVVQLHHASRRHYDFRLQVGDALKSWAVPKGPSYDPDVKRMAVEVEDHPLDYGSFEGTIPKGNYGAGTVQMWDTGEWEPQDADLDAAFKKGVLKLELHGERLKGGWALIRLKSDRGKPSKRNNWLLIKGDDDQARTEGDILEERPESVKTGRQIAEVAEGVEKPARKPATRKAAARKPAPRKAGAKDAGTPAVKGAKRGALPDFVPPMLATLVSSAPSGKEWLHEIKFDGYRLQARVEDGAVRLLTRSGLDWSERFGDGVLKALAALPVETALIDGELVVEAGTGASDFSALQADLSEGRSDRFVFYAFDLMHLDGMDLRGAALAERKALLQPLLAEAPDTLRYSDHFAESGDMVLQHACRLSLEGIVSKLADSPYRAGRGKAWVKSKCSARQEFVIGGYVPSTVSPKLIGSLVLGVHQGGTLRHVGRVGTGFSAAVAADLFRRLEPMTRKTSPFDGKLTATEARQVRYVEPELVAEVEFRAWTADGHLRHAAFRGLREDKPAAEIVREEPRAGAKPAAPPRRTVRLTHPDRIYWPDAGVTKEGLADYYAEVWRHIAPHLVGRPLALLRCPGGIDGQKFFQKHAWKGLNPRIVQVRDPKDKAGEPLIAIEDLDGLMGLVQAAALEIHPWGSTLASWEKPDQIVMDLDPGEGVPWTRVIEAALEIRQRLKDAGLASFVKTSGGKGLHVVAPLKPQATWPTVKSFTKALADSMAKDDPDRYVATVAKSKRQGKILIDYLRNQRGATAVAAYSTRARPGAPVSTPLDWEELGPDIGPAHFTVANLPARLAALTDDPWDGFRAAAVPLPTRKR